MSIRLETGQMRTEHDRREIYPRMPATSIAADSTECFSSHKPLGSERLPATNLLSLRGEKRDQLQNRRCLTLQFDRYNAVNANSATTVSFASGAVWGDIGHPAELSSRTFCTFAREFSPFTVSLAPPDLTCRDVDRVLGHYAVRQAEASIRPAEYGQLMAQRHHLEEEVSTCGQRGEERRDRERVAHGR